MINVGVINPGTGADTMSYSFEADPYVNIIPGNSPDGNAGFSTLYYPTPSVTSNVIRVQFTFNNGGAGSTFQVNLCRTLALDRGA